MPRLAERLALCWLWLRLLGRYDPSGTYRLGPVVAWRVCRVVARPHRDHTLHTAEEEGPHD